jgi:hypothetical protein
MKRRTFFQRLFGSLGAVVATPVVVADSRSVVIQESPVAGFQFHQGEAAWPSLFIGAPLALQREPSNPHDVDAVAVYFKAEKLGYVPRAENRAVAQMLDRGENLKATITKMSEGEDPWERGFSISLV